MNGLISKVFFESLLAIMVIILPALLFLGSEPVVQLSYQAKTAIFALANTIAIVLTFKAMSRLIKVFRYILKNQETR